jgi:hypothetical protein
VIVDGDGPCLSLRKSIPMPQTDSFRMPIEDWELREIWEANNMSTVDAKSDWHIIRQYKFFEIEMLGYKFRRGLFKKDAWWEP